MVNGGWWGLVLADGSWWELMVNVLNPNVLIRNLSPQVCKKISYLPRICQPVQWKMTQACKGSSHLGGHLNFNSTMIVGGRVVEQEITKVGWKWGSVSCRKKPLVKTKCCCSTALKKAKFCWWAHLATSNGLRFLHDFVRRGPCKKCWLSLPKKEGNINGDALFRRKKHQLTEICRCF